ncbi:MAG: c-di-GMP phosphodiesterase [Patescibacteria group bacterium]|nr:c-di-GMP phosphodiesterase [Patescibacteria group bacterium]
MLFDGSMEDSAVGRLLEKLQNSEGAYLGNPIPISFSAGVVTSSGSGHEIMESSSRALQHSKERGEYVIFDDNLKTSGQYREGLEMASIVRLALEKNLVKPFFQEIVRNPPLTRFPVFEKTLRRWERKLGFRGNVVPDDSAKKFESLARICDFQEHGNIILPGRFLPAAKKIGKLRSVTQAMIDGIIPVMLEHPEYSFSVNLSEEDLLSPSTVDFIRSKIEASGINPAMLTLEILEEVDPSDSDRAMEVVRELKALGCRIGIDDFGSRYSNFARLRDFEPDYVKIDMKYVRNIHRNDRNRILVETIVDYSHKNGIKVIAEGIETPEEQEVIVQLGVDYSQGYLFSKPFGSIPESR